MNSREAFDVQVGEVPTFMVPVASNVRYVSDQSRAAPVGGRGKRALDVLFAIIALIILAPLMLVLAVAVKLHDGGPVLYGQMRIGHRGRSFRCLKFRSMVPNADAVLRELLERDPAARAEWLANQKLKADPRCTAFGRFIRRTSLDELPQLINVLRGDMSLVGPRPIVSSEARFYGNAFDDYKLARPGVTGLWQVSGRSDTTYDERVQLDTHYVHNWSVFRDLSIIMRTIVVVFRSDGSY